MALILSSPLLMNAQNPPADAKTQNPPPAVEKKESTSPKPAEKKTEEPVPGQLKLETPEAPQSPASQPAPKAGAQPQSPPQNLQLETPKAAPAEGQKLENPPAPTQPPEEEHKPTIEQVVFRGNRRVPAATLRARVYSKAGDVYDESALERDFMSLWNTGFLDDIRLEIADAPNGNKILTFYVREKKLVRSIDYKGLSSVQTSDVLDE